MYSFYHDHPSPVLQHTRHGSRMTDCKRTVPSSLTRTNRLKQSNSPGSNPLDYHIWGAVLEKYQILELKPKTIDESEVVFAKISNSTEVGSN